MNQDLLQNNKILESVLRNTLNNKLMTDRGKKGILGKIEFVQNNVSSQFTRAVAGSDEQVRQLLGSLNLIQQNLLDIFETNKLEEVAEYCISDYNFEGNERSAVVQKHRDLLQEQNTEAQSFLSKQLNVPLDDKNGLELITQHRQLNNAYNSCLDNLIAGIQARKDVKEIVFNRLNIQNEDNKLIQQRQYQQLQQAQQQNRHLQQQDSMAMDNGNMIYGDDNQQYQGLQDNNGHNLNNNYNNILYEEQIDNGQDQMLHMGMNNQSQYNKDDDDDVDDDDDIDDYGHI